MTHASHDPSARYGSDFYYEVRLGPRQAKPVQLVETRLRPGARRPVRYEPIWSALMLRRARNVLRSGTRRMVVRWRGDARGLVEIYIEGRCFGYARPL